MLSKYKKVVISMLLVISLIFSFNDVSKAAITKTMVIEFNESLSSNREKTVYIPNLQEIVSVNVDTGSVNYTINGENVTVRVSSGSSCRSEYNSKKYSRYESDYRTTSTGGSLPTYLDYSSGGYSGKLYESGSRYVIGGSPSGSKIVSESIGPQASTSFPSTKNYSSGGYSGALYKDGSYRYTGSGVDNKIVSDFRVTSSGGDPSSLPSKISYSVNGYIGELGESGSAYVVSGSPAGQTYIDKMYIGRVTSRGYSNGEYHEGRFPYWHYHAGTWCSGGRKGKRIFKL